MNTIYRGYNIDNEGGDLPFKVKQGDVKVYAARTEEDAMAFIDKSKREEAAKKRGES